MNLSGAETTEDTFSGRSGSPLRSGMLRNIVHLSLGQVATTVLAVLLSAAIARTLGASEFGLLYLVTTIATFAYVFVDWGHAAYVTREIARHPARAGDLIGSVMAVRGATALIVSGPVVVTTWLLGYDLSTVLLTVTLIVAWIPGYLAMSYSWVFRGVERMDYDALINVVMKFCTLALSVAVLALGGRVLSLILLSVVNGFITLAVAVALYRRLQLPRPRMTTRAARELLYGGAPMLAMGVTVAVQPYLNANILYALVPRSVIGLYGAAWSIGGTLVAPATILAAGVYPRFSKAAGDPDHLRRVLRAAFRPLLLVGILGAVGTFLFADIAIEVVYSAQEFGEAADILKAFAPGLLLLYVDMFLGSALLAAGKAGRLAAIKAAAVVVTTGLGFILTSMFQTRYGNGGIGVMIAMAGGELVMVSAMMLLVRDVIDRQMFVDLVRGLAAGGMTMAITTWLSVETPFIAIPFCVLVFLGLSMVLGLVNRSDLKSLTSTFRRQSPGDRLGDGGVSEGDLA